MTDGREPIRWRRRAVLALPWLWLGLFFIVPLVLVVKISLSHAQLGVPPYTPLLNMIDGHVAGIAATLANYRALAEDVLYLRAYVGSIKIAGAATLMALLLAYPMAYAIATAPPAWRGRLLLLVVLPFWTSFLVRVYAWIGLLRPGGMINSVLQAMGVIHGPLRMLNTDGAVILGIVYAYLPFMVLPLYARLERLDRSLLEAAADLGAKPWRVFLHITLPLSLPGVAAGCLLVFIPAMGEFVIPELMGGPDTLMIGRVLWNEFFTNRDWPLSAAFTVVTLAALMGPLVLFQTLRGRRSLSAAGSGS